MVDLIGKYIKQIGVKSKQCAEECGRTEIGIKDIDFVFKEMGINVSELKDYIQNFSTASLDTAPVVPFPAPSEMKLNFLKPGSREVLIRKNHIYDYLPAMYPEMEMKASPTQLSPGESCMAMDVGADHCEIDAIGNSGYTENNPLREIHSVMMTSQGFISPAREGKLPQSRTPLGAAREVLAVKNDNEKMQPPPFEEKLPIPAKKNVVGKPGRRGKNKKLSVFQKKVPLKQESNQPELKLDHSDDIINSVIERGVMESEQLDAKSPKKSKKIVETKADIIKEVTPSPPPTSPTPPPPTPVTPSPPVKISTPPPLSPVTPTTSTPVPSSLSEIKLPPNPLLPKPPYGFGMAPEKKQKLVEETSPVTKKLKHDKHRDKSSKKKKLKKSKYDDERHSKKEKSKKKKRDRSPQSSQTLPGIKLKMKDSSSEKTKVVIKTTESKPPKKQHVDVGGPKLFEEPFKYERKLAVVPVIPPPVDHSSSSQDLVKKKRGRPERKEKPSKKREKTRKKSGLW